MLKIIKYLFSKDIPLYKQVYRNLENEQFPQAIKNVWNLSKIGMCDQQLWQKMEYVFKKWQNHLNMEDLIQFAHLLSLNQRFVSPQLKVSYEYRIKKCKTKPDERQIETLILKLLPLMNEGCKQYLIQQYLETQTMNDESQLKCMIKILENTKSHRNRIVEKLNYLGSLKEYENIQEIILYLELFYSDIPKQWHNEVLIREKIQEGMCEILQGFKVPSQLDKCVLSLVVQPLDHIYSQMQCYKQDDFKFFMAMLQFVKACQFSNTEFKNKEELNLLLTSIYKKLVPIEVISTIEILHNQIDLIEFINNYLDFSLENLDNKTLIKFIFSNNQFIKNADIAQRLIDKLSITITQGEQLTDIQLCLTQSNKLFPNLKTSIEPLLKHNLSLMQKYYKISNKISFDVARHLTLNQNLELHQIQSIWKKVRFSNLEEVERNLKRLRKDVQQNTIDPDTLTAIHDSMKDCFKLQLIH